MELAYILLRDGLLTLMYSASLIALLRFWSSLPTILKFSMVTWWPVMFLWSCIGEGAFWCSLNLSPNDLEDSPIYSYIAVNPATLVSIDDPTLFQYWARSPTWWFLTTREWVKASRRSVANIVYKFILKEAIPSKASWWTPRIKILYWKRVGSSIDTRVAGLTAMKNILVNPQDQFGERFKEHQKAPSPIHDHRNITGHQVTIENFNIVGRKDQNLSRAIKEALYIRVNNPSLNKNIGKFHLPHIWDEVLFNTSELKLK